MPGSNEEWRFLDEKTQEELSFDIVVVGAGIAGISAAYRIQTDGPRDTRFAILEGRESLGGTWDLFRYPGIRSDSDMFTFGFPWSPWNHNETLATGGEIKEYMKRSAQSVGIDKHIYYGRKVVSADWNSEEKRWELQATILNEYGERKATYHARFVILGTGYYDYEKPLQTIIPGIENFAGKIVHPQFWPEDYDYTDKNVVVIGSGATAITIVPTMAEKARRVTMLQRSPGYMVSLPSSTLGMRLLKATLPARLAYFILRGSWLIRSLSTNKICKWFPGIARKLIRRQVMKQLPSDVAWDPHFNPRYDPWDQRVCLCKDGDFFAALRSGKAGVVTDQIKTITETSIELVSGNALQPDVIVTATGLKLRFGGGIRYSVDGQPISPTGKFAWQSTMLQDVPNLFFLAGYENASWTLGTDVGARLFVRILKKMHQKGATVAVARPEEPYMLCLYAHVSFLVCTFLVPCIPSRD